jgi:hypothetical protein
MSSIRYEGGTARDLMKTSVWCSGSQSGRGKHPAKLGPLANQASLLGLYIVLAISELLVVPASVAATSALSTSQSLFSMMSANYLTAGIAALLADVLAAALAQQEALERFGADAQRAAGVLGFAPVAPEDAAIVVHVPNPAVQHFGGAKPQNELSEDRDRAFVASLAALDEKRRKLPRLVKP